MKIHFFQSMILKRFKVRDHNKIQKSEKTNINRSKLLGHSCLKHKEIMRKELVIFLLLSSVR